MSQPPESRLERLEAEIERLRAVRPFESYYTATINETVAATGIGRTTLYKMIVAGEVETTTIGTRRLVLVRSVINRLNNQSGASK